MPNLRPYIGPTKLVVAFDIGTTYSAISYCILEQGKVPEVLGVTSFPTQAPVTFNAKVPSLLYYDDSGHVRAAGAEVLSESVLKAALTEGWTRAEWWKLHLCPKHLASTINLNDDLPALPRGKSAVDVLTDFIKYLFHCAQTYIRERHLDLPWTSIEHSIEYIFTHPNGWEGLQQQLYRRAIERAGLVPSTPEGRSRVHLLTDGEAALHFCVPDYVAIRSTNHTVRHGIAIIDAGGATIDSSVFSMASKPISCEEIAPAECLLQGSVFVTRRARVLLQKKLEGWEHSSPEEIAKFTREFDQSTKLAIQSDQEPAYVRVASRRTNSARYDITFGKLELTGAEAAGLFNESLDAIISVFEQQQKSVKIAITTAFFLGGLSTNDLLWGRLHPYFQERNVDIWRPDRHIGSAVASGAVLSHVDRDSHMVASRVARATYGIVCAIPVNADNEEHIRRRCWWETDPTGDRYVPGYFTTFLHKGARLREEMEFRDSYTLTERHPKDFGVQIVSLVCYRGNLSNPKWVDHDSSSFSILCTIRADLNEATSDLISKRGASGRVYYQLDYDIIVCFGLTEIQAYLGWRSKYGERRRVRAAVSFEE